MAEQEYALPDISEEQVEKAALPVGKRADQEASDEAKYIDLEENKDELKSIEEDTIQENFETSDKVVEENKDKGEVEKKAAYAQNRINKAVAQAKDFQRRELMAVQYAKQLEEENNKLKATKQSFEKTMFDSRKSETDSTIELAKQAHKQAVEVNDAEAIARATELLSTAIAEKKYIEANEQRSQFEADYDQAVNQEVESPLQEPQQVQEYAEPSPKAQAWANKNSWFGQDRVATTVALTIHEQLANEGFDLNSDEYYNELDNRLRSEIPNKFDNNVEATKPVQTVASPSRTTSTGRKPSNRVELSPSEQRLAKRLGVSFKDYAIQKARLQKS